MPDAPQSILNALTFDIEDWFHLLKIESVSDPRLWPTLPTLAERYTDLILQLLAEKNVRATFFTVGWVAERYPSIVKKIVRQGHEIAAHSYWHRAVSTLTPEEFRSDLWKCIDTLEQQGGRKVMGFRAPGFTITRHERWAFDVMLDLGLKYDASLCPTYGRYAGYDCPLAPHICNDAPSGRPIPELPMSVVRIGRRGLRFTGGGYLRLLPGFIIEAGIRRLNRGSIPGVIYLHPRDFALDCPRPPMPFHRRFMSYVGISSTRGKLLSLLEHFRFGTCAEVLGVN